MRGARPASEVDTRNLPSSPSSGYFGSTVDENEKLARACEVSELLSAHV